MISPGLKDDRRLKSRPHRSGKLGRAGCCLIATVLTSAGAILNSAGLPTRPRNHPRRNLRWRRNLRLPHEKRPQLLRR